MKRVIIATIVIVLLIGGLLCLVCADRYQHAVYLADAGIFTKAICYIDEFPFIVELYDPGFVSYAYAGEAIEYGLYDEAIERLKPLADKNYRNSVQMLEYCMEEAK